MKPLSSMDASWFHGESQAMPFHVANLHLFDKPAGRKADLLGELPEDRSGEILKEMEPEERQEVTQLLEFGEHTAAGRMTTEFVSVGDYLRVDDAIEALRQFEGSREAVATVYLYNVAYKVVGRRAARENRHLVPRRTAPDRPERAVRDVRARHPGRRSGGALRQVQPDYAAGR